MSLPKDSNVSNSAHDCGAVLRVELHTISLLLVSLRRGIHLLISAGAYSTLQDALLLLIKNNQVERLLSLSAHRSCG